MNEHPLSSPATDKTGHPLDRLRRLMAEKGIDAYLVPRADEHQGEYVPASAMRLQWLTGFSGSAGIAAVTLKRAALFIDGRYTLQAATQTDPARFELCRIETHRPDVWLEEALSPGAKLGIDPWLHTPDAVERLRAACLRAKAELVPLDGNLVDALWTDRPHPPAEPAVPHPLIFAGRSSAEKRAGIAAALRRENENAVLLSAPDSIAWLLNIRGGDVPFTPLALSFALLHDDASVDLFIDPAKITADLPAHLGPAVRLSPPDAFGPALDRLKGYRVRLDPAWAPVWAEMRLCAAGAQVVHGADPCLLPKACRNDVEMEGVRAAHRRDAVPMIVFLAWLDREAPKGTLSEIDCARQLDEMRRELGGPLYRGPSFPTISGTGPNGAIVHYSVTPASSRPLAPGDLYLVDSGGQYLDGTTDITRTVAIGPAGEEEKHRFTLVLKGHIALARARFPLGVNGGQLDVLARRALWAEGLDYAHGTGHGIGSYLSVHEGPQRIAKAGSGQTLLPGMIVSNEPGYYKTDAYGIRIESVLAVIQDGGAADMPMLAFETLTLVPIDRRLILPGLLDATERAWIDSYHAHVGKTVAPFLDERSQAWLAQATAPIASD
ncbi:MAG: aminopeptidase P family protein [Rhodospirillaceae bacterium]|nr:aminopeptidase P family protein [Rhodospirillaceae bacterium]